MTGQLEMFRIPPGFYAVRFRSRFDPSNYFTFGVWTEEKAKEQVAYLKRVYHINATMEPAK